MKWFRNLVIYQLEETPQFSEPDWHQKLEKDMFQPCLSDQPYSQGWVSPSGDLGISLSHNGNNSTLLSLRREERLLPAGVVNEALDEKVAEIELKEESQARSKRTFPNEGRNRFRNDAPCFYALSLYKRTTTDK